MHIWAEHAGRRWENIFDFWRLLLLQVAGRWDMHDNEQIISFQINSLQIIYIATWVIKILMPRHFCTGLFQKVISGSGPLPSAICGTMRQMRRLQEGKKRPRKWMREVLSSWVRRRRSNVLPFLWKSFWVWWVNHYIMIWVILHCTITQSTILLKNLFE